MPSAELVANADVFLWALYELDGAGEFVEVEDVFLRAFNLAPERFSWRTRRLPDLKKCAKSLQEAEARQPKLLVKNGPYLRMLSAEGQKWIEENFDRLVDVLDPEKAVQPPKRRRPSRLVTLATNSNLFKQWSESGQLPAERWQIAQFLNCSPDSASTIWNRRFEELRSAARLADHQPLMRFLDVARDQRKEWFGDE